MSSSVEQVAPRTVARRLSSNKSGNALLNRIPAEHLDSLLRDCRSPLLMMRLKALGVAKAAERLAVQQALREEEDRITRSTPMPMRTLTPGDKIGDVLQPIAQSPVKQHPLSDLTNSSSLLDLTNPTPSQAFSKRLASTPMIPKATAPHGGAQPSSSVIKRISSSPTAAFTPTNAVATATLAPEATRGTWSVRALLFQMITFVPRTLGRLGFRLASLPLVIALSAISLYFSLVCSALRPAIRLAERVAVCLGAPPHLVARFSRVMRA